jgi:hypothetical protein
MGGKYLYENWKPFHDVCDDAGHFAVGVGKSIGHGISSIMDSIF